MKDACFLLRHWDRANQTVRPTSPSEQQVIDAATEQLNHVTIASAATPPAGKRKRPENTARQSGKSERTSTK